MRRFGSGMPTSSSSPMARRLAAPRPILSWARIASTTCHPTVYCGCRLDSGSWKTIAMRSPRMRCIASPGSVSRSAPPNHARPSTRAPRSNWRIACTETDFPEPDSPTMPTVSPAATSNEIPRTAWTSPSSVGNVTERSVTDSSVLDVIDLTPSRDELTIVHCAHCSDEVVTCRNAPEVRRPLLRRRRS
jgi:hypothetical protein